MRPEVKWFIKVWVVALAVIGVGFCGMARAQWSSYQDWATRVEIERVGGNTWSQLIWKGSETMPPRTLLHPSDVGGVSPTVRTLLANADGAKFTRSVGVPYTSPMSGAQYTLGAVATRTASKQQIAKALTQLMKVANIMGGPYVLGGSILASAFMNEGGVMKHLMVAETAGTTPPPTPPTTVYRYPPVTPWNPSLATACQAHASYQQSIQASNCTVGQPKSWYTGTSYLTNPDLYCINGRKSTYDCGATLGANEDANLGWSFQSQSGCVDPATLQGGQCVTPPSGPSCPTGYAQSTFFYGTLTCAPDGSQAPYPAFTMPDEMLDEGNLSHIGTSPAVLLDGLEALKNAPYSPVLETFSPEIESLHQQSLAPTSASFPTPSGGTITRTITPRTTLDTPQRIKITEDVEEVERDAQGNITRTTTTTTATPEVPNIEVKSCGLPDTAACKIDETGTATEAEGRAAAAVGSGALTTGFDAAKQAPADALAQLAPNTSFGLTFGFPVGCVDPPPFTSSRWGGVNIVPAMCQHEGLIHSAMSFVWLLLTSFACIGMIRESAG